MQDTSYKLTEKQQKEIAATLKRGLLKSVTTFDAMLQYVLDKGIARTNYELDQRAPEKIAQRAFNSLKNNPELLAQLLKESQAQAKK